MKSIYEFLLKNKTAASTQDMGYVDLGLPSGLLWAKCNIGADEPYEYGDYFMWGSTKPDTDKSCNWKNCPFNNGDDGYDKGYFYSVKTKVCPNGILAPEYDATTVILGDDWGLPTEDEFQELVANTAQEWIKNYQGSRINGMLFTPKNGEAAKANSNENYVELFIPAAGYRFGSSFHSQVSSAYLWSSSLYMNGANGATCLSLDEFSCWLASSSRNYGFCLRGVKENKNK